MKATSRPFRASQYGKCPIKNGASGEHHAINKGDSIVRISPGVKWTEVKTGRYGKKYLAQLSTDYAHVGCLEKLNERKGEQS
jgi:hypothetical protein